MTRSVELPLWLFVLILFFAGVAFLSHFLFPSVRWFFRRRMERAVARLNTRLVRPIQPFKLMARPDMIVRLVHDPKVAEAVAEEAAASGEPETVVHERARRYAREIVPGFSTALYFGIANRMARWCARLLYRVEVLNDDAMGSIDPNATVVFVMNHRSNMDYVLVTYLAARQSALAYAVGEWAQVWPLSWLFRSMGAYFIRRKHNTALYRRVLARYVQMATQEGVTQAVFPEGGLSLDGRVGKPKLGILSYIVSGHQPEGRDIVFVPVSISYDRVLEDRVLVAANAAGVRRFRAPFGSILAFIGRHVWRGLLGRFRRFGSAAVHFGEPISLLALAKSNCLEGDGTEFLADTLMRNIAADMPALGVPMVAAVWGSGPLDRESLVQRVEALSLELQNFGANVLLPEGGAAAAVDAALKVFAIRRMITRPDAEIAPDPSAPPLLAFYAAQVLQMQETRVQTNARI